MLDMEPRLGPSQGCLLSLAFCFFFWSAVLIVALWRGWL